MKNILLPGGVCGMNHPLHQIFPVLPVPALQNVRAGTRVVY